MTNASDIVWIIPTLVEELRAARAEIVIWVTSSDAWDDDDLHRHPAIARIDAVIAATPVAAPRSDLSPAAPGLPVSRDDEAIHAKLDLILEGNRRIMSQQDELMDALTAISGEVDTLKDHAADLETKLAAKADDLGVDLSQEITLAQSIKAKLEGVSAAVTTSVDDSTMTPPAGADTTVAVGDTPTDGAAPAPAPAPAADQAGS